MVSYDEEGKEDCRFRPKKLVIIGAGPAGLSAGYEAVRHSGEYVPRIFEAASLVGGISRTETNNGYKFDIGGHRFFTKVPAVEQMWHEILPSDFLTRPRQSRIYYRNRFFEYPLKTRNALRNIGFYESLRIILSYLKWQVRPNPTTDSFEHWVINRFGGRLYMHFFRSYTEKVWGIDPKRIQSDWAAQRIKNLSLFKAVWNAVTGSNDTASMIEQFQYPRLGPGMMWERCSDLIREKGGEVRLHAPVVKVRHKDKKVTEIEIAPWDEAGNALPRETVKGDSFINTMALRDFVECLDPQPPEPVRAAARKLSYRDFLIVTLVLKNAEPFPDNWIYIHSPTVQVARIQNFRAWSPDMVPNDTTSSIGMEYFCQEDDALWSMSDLDLRDLAAQELQALGLGSADQVIDAAVIRQPKAYPVYDENYSEALKVIRNYLSGFENFQTVGRNGLHRYNNQDHSMLSAMYAVRNLLGAEHDVWNVNVDQDYHEEDKKGGRRSKADAPTERMQPRRLPN